MFENELQDKISKIRLTNEDDPNSAHVTMLYFKGKWVFLIDFKCKKSEAKKRYKAGKEFYEIERSAIVMDIGEYLWITYFSSIKIICYQSTTCSFSYNENET